MRDRSTFLALRRRGARGRAGPVTVTWLPGDRSSPPRVAYAIGRTVGNAVVRNRLRRRLRAVVTELALPPGALLLSVGPSAALLPYPELRAHVTDALRQATDRRGDHRS